MRPETYNQGFSRLPQGPVARNPQDPMSTPQFTVADIRQTFLDFFKARSHAVVASSSLVPGNDPTLMFTN